MRFVFTALLLVNFGFFAWARWIDNPLQGAASGAPRNSLPALQLVRPQAGASGDSPPLAAAPTGAPTAAAQADIAAAPMRCRTIGPFDDAPAAGAVVEQLRDRGLAARERTVESETPDGYWVYIAYLKDAAAQRHMIASLNAAGIHDATAMTQPEQSDRVSLGVFADQAHAVRRAEQVSALGFKPMLQLRQRAVTQRWLDFDLKATDAEPGTAQLLSGVAPAARGANRVQIADCPAYGARP